MTPEHRIMNEIRLWCGEHDILCFRANVGTFLLADGTYVNTGLPKGFSDLIALKNGGECVFIECKAKYGKQSEEQIRFQQAVESKGFKYILARCVADVEQQWTN